MDELLVAAIVAFSPAFALIWIKIADVTKKSMDSADETAITEKANTGIVTANK